MRSKVIKYSLSIFIPGFILLSGFLCGCLFLSSEIMAAELSVRTPYGAPINKRVMSMKEMKFRNIIRQETDFSCGAASMATIMRYFYDDANASENEIVEWLLKNGDAEKIQERGFSLLDLKIYAQNIGYKADGYMVKPEQLPKIKIPTIVLMNTNGYSHFVVLKGVLDGTAYVADPALGNRRVPMDEFLNAWNGIVFVVHGKEMSSTYGRFDGPLSVNKAEIWRLNDLMMRNLFMNAMEFRR
ncbi:MAG: C39 family peptidase [Nitrospirota bacterium]